MHVVNYVHCRKQLVGTQICVLKCILSLEVVCKQAACVNQYECCTPGHPYMILVIADKTHGLSLETVFKHNLKQYAISIHAKAAQ